MGNIYFRMIVWVSVFLMGASISLALELMVDNSDPQVTVTGSWTTSTSGCYGPDKYTNGPGTGTETVTWNPTLDPGWYVIYFRMNSNTGYAEDARYAITHRDGTDNLVVSQRKGSSGFYVLGGAYYFNGSGTVTLSDQFSSGTLVVADAMRFWSVFSFVQMSDSHVGYSRGSSNTTAVVSELKTLGKCTMASYGFSAPPPSFAIHSGDFTEYGQEYWSTLISVFSGLPFSVYFVQGNHDSTWSSCKERIRTLFGATPYSFDHYDRGQRFHFACLNSPILQSPRAGFSREELEWLETDLAGLESNTPVFLNFHHPIDGASDPKPFDTYRLLQILRPYRLVSIFYGHGHSNTDSLFDTVRIVQGGSTYNDSTDKGNYNLIAMTHGRMYVAKKICGDPTAASAILNMTIPASATYPTISVESPPKDSIQTVTTIPVSASIAGTLDTITAAAFELNGDATWRPLSGSGYGPYTGSVSLSSAIHGRHWIRVRFTTATSTWYQMVAFWHWDGFPSARWIVDMGASSLSTPAVANGKVYVGAHGGTFRCVNVTNGSEIWKKNLPGDVMSSPEVSEGRVVFGCGNSKVYCLDASTGADLWTKTCAGPMYSSPTINGGTVYIGSIGSGSSSSRYLYSLNLSTGAENWKFSAGNAIETKPFVLSGTVFFGSWDSYFYAVNTSNGTQKWRYQRNSNRYYSPADSWPVASSSANRVFVADREYYLSAIDISTGLAAWTPVFGVSSQGITPDGTGLLQRMYDGTGNLKRTDFNNSSVWTRDSSLDTAPVSPLCNGTRAAVVDQDGLATVLTLSTGSIEYQFQVARGYELHPVNLDDRGSIYASTYEGFLLCINNHDDSGVEQWERY